MTHAVARTLGLAAGLAAVLGVRGALGASAAVALLAGEALVGLAGWTWRARADLPRLDRRLARRLGASALAGLIGAGATGAAGLAAGAPAVVLALAGLGLGASVAAHLRLRGAALPAEGEPPARAVFEGTLHAERPPALPGLPDRPVALWLARQGRRRWSSAARVELRDAHRRVWIEPGRARGRGEVWIMDGALGRAAAGALAGADPAAPVRVWRFVEGDRAYVVGGARLIDDPTAAYRDPARRAVFDGPLVVGDGSLAGARREARARAAIWGALALAAGAAGLGWA